ANFGDVIVADPAWDYGSGKHYQAEGIAKFSPSPHHLALDTHLRNRVRQLAQEEKRLASIWAGPLS
ncbi:MAG TPA: hypothetical protein VM715_21480, partial [Candidatus Acidoferrum sp.]|nr:hypothetical protein [Candidatus Acidoferrum sp.]